MDNEQEKQLKDMVSKMTAPPKPIIIEVIGEGVKVTASSNADVQVVYKK